MSNKVASLVAHVQLKSIAALMAHEYLLDT